MAAGGYPRRALLIGPAVEAWDRDEIAAAGMGALAAVARGSHEEAQLIVLRYEPPDAAGLLVAAVGKGVTSTRAAVLKPKESLACGPAGLRVGASENAIGGAARRPGDVLHALDDTTIEMVNTDAEGRLVLADCLAYARREGAERLVDVATLTCGAVTAFGFTHAALFVNNEDWAVACVRP